MCNFKEKKKALYEGAIEDKLLSMRTQPIAVD
jgi:hypothetical protein